MQLEAVDLASVPFSAVEIEWVVGKMRNSMKIDLYKQHGNTCASKHVRKPHGNWANAE